MNLIYGDGHVDPYFPDEPIPLDDPLGGTGDAGGEGADEGGGEGTSGPPVRSDLFDYESALRRIEDRRKADEEAALRTIEDQQKAVDRATQEAWRDGRLTPQEQDRIHRLRTELAKLIKGFQEELRSDDRDLGADSFFGSGLDGLGRFLPPTAGEGAGGLGPGFAPANPSLDPQIDAGSGLLDGVPSAPVLAPTVPAGPAAPAGPDLAALHDNFHAQQAADLAAFQAIQDTDHNNSHTQLTNAHGNFHNLLGVGPGFGAQHGNFHAQEGQAHGDFHAQQADDLAAEQAQQDAEHTQFHQDNNI